MNARALGYQTMVDEKTLRPVQAHFNAIAKQENLPIGKPLEYDAFHPQHQVPGGMISNFRFQLDNLGKLDQLPAVLQEVSRVRAEFGYPIMVTPYSQFFGVQAAINVMVGQRYKEVTDEVLLYARQTRRVAHEATVLGILASIARARNDNHTALPTLERAITLAESAGLLRLLAKMQASVADIHREAGALAKAEQFAELAAASTQESGDTWAVPARLQMLAELQLAGGKTCRGRSGF